MRQFHVRLTISRMMVGVLIFALIAALWAQHHNANLRLANLQADLARARASIPDPYKIASAGGLRSKVEAAGDRVLIVATATLFDLRFHMSYVWTIRITDPTGQKLLFRKRYDHRGIRPILGQDFQTSFVDILQPGLPPGDYRVRFSLLEFSSDTDRSAWDREENHPGLVPPLGYEVLGSTGKITIADDQEKQK